MKKNIALITFCILTFQLQAQVSFKLGSSPGVGNYPDLVVAVDVNGDGKVDLISANGLENTLSVLTNNGNGGFTLASSPIVGSQPRWVAAADVNGDGKVDLISANYGGLSGNTLSVLTNTGNGNFVLAFTPVLPAVPYSVAVADVNGDGKMDLISANNNSTITILTNNGSGGFVVASSPSVGGDERSVTAFTNVNGNVDLVTANQYNNTLSLMTNNGSGGFALAALLTSGSQPLQVAAADVNGDGKVDLISANYGDNTLSVWTNNGTGGFALSSSPHVGQQPFYVVAADLNSDGKLDLISANFTDNTLTVLTNNNKGGFVFAGTLAVGNNPLSVTAADVNGDGKPDLISANGHSNNLSIWLNTTSSQNQPIQTGGTVVAWGACCGKDFGQVTPPAGLSNVVAIAAGSYFNLALIYGGTVVGWGQNGSGQITIPTGLSNVVAIAAGENHSLALTASGTVIGWGDNSAGQTTIPSGLSNVIAISAFGEQSLALTASGSVVSWGDNSAGQRNIPAGLTNVVAISAGDYFDLALTTAGKVVAWGSNIYGQTNVPAGLSNIVAIAAGSSLGNAQSWGLALTSGGQVVGWGGNNFGQISIPSGLSNVVAIATGWYHSMVLKADGTVAAWGASGANFGQLTPPAGLSNVVAIAGGNVHSLALVENNRVNITKQPASQTVAVGSTATLTLVASGSTPLNYQWSFNSTNIIGATNATLVIPNLQLTNGGNYFVTIRNSYGAVTSSIATLTVLLPAQLQGQVSFNLSSSPGAGANPYSVVAADVNGDGQVDLISANINANTLSVLTNNGSGGFGLSHTYAVGNTPVSVTAADVNGDGKVDLICANANGNTLSVLTNNGSGGFALATSPSVGNRPWAVTAADLNGDGKPDLICANNFGDSMTVLTNNGNGVFTLAATLAVGKGPDSVTAADVNGDGKLDLICANGGTTTLSVYTNTGSGGFVVASLPGVGNAPFSAVAADVNGDGKLDLICANYYDNTLSVLTNNGSGGFATAGTYAVGHVPVSVTAADVSGDGKVDLICANYNDSTLSVLTNNGSGGFALAALPAVGLNPNSVVAADVNGDGKLDLISANYGNNTLSVLLNTTSSQNQPIQTGGTVVGWGGCCGYNFGQVTPPAGLSNVVAVAAGSYFSLALTSGETVVGWGQNGSGQITIPAGLSNVVAIAAGENHSLALTASGTVIGWGDNSAGQTNIPSGLSNVIAISAFGEQSLALTASGSVVSWGNNSAGQRNIPAGLTNAIAIAAGDYFDLALTAAGKVVAWGSNTYGQTNVPAGLSNVVAIAAGSSLGNAQSWGLALTSGGQVVGWGGNNFGQISIPSGLSNVVAIATGWYDSMALKADGTVVAWGASGANYGQLTPPAGLSNVVAIAGGNVHSLALVETNQTGVIVITSQPTNQTVYVGNATALTVAASGTPPLSYQWSFNSNNIVGATNAMLIIPNVQLTNNGNYFVIVSNSYGSVTSSIAALTVLLPATITSQPQSVTATAGSTVSFSVVAAGSLPLSFHWSLNSTNLAGATNATLTLTNVQPAQAGNYSVRVSNLGGSTNSATATLMVNTPASCDAPPAGLVSWWPGEGNANDIVGGNNGLLMNGTGFTNGEVGMAFNLNGINNFILVNPSPNLNGGSSNGFTIEGWINPANLTSFMFLGEYERNLATANGSDVGVHFAINQPGPCSFYANIKDTTGTDHLFLSASGLITAGKWQHVAVTYDKTSGLSTFYLNGVAVTQTNLGSFIPETTFTNLVLGARTAFNSVANPANVFAGEMDEISVYNRALSANEIASIYGAGSAGKCAPETTACTPPPAGLVSWWPAEGNANDIVGGNNGRLMNGTSFTNGEVGEAFNLNGVNNFVLVNAGPNLTTGLQNGFTFESWINPATVTSVVELFEYERALATYNGSDVGILFAIHNTLPDGTPGSCLYANLLDTNGVVHVIASPANLLTAGVWQHVALSYDKASGMAAIFINGVAVTQTNLGTFTPQTGFTNLLLGARTTFGSVANPPNAYAGGMDEASFYSRALSPSEIAGIYSAGSAGKCAPVTTACTPPPAGLVSWWPGEGNANDIIGGNNGTLHGGIAYAAGEVGRAFSFNDTNAAVIVPASASLNVGTGSGFTLEAWIKPAEVTNITPIFEWNVGDGTSYWGVHFWICPGQPFSASPGPGELYADIVDTSGGNHQLSSNGGATAPGVLQHVALTYDKTTGLATIYCNGVIVAQQNLGKFTPQTTYNLYLGRRPGPDVVVSYAGLLDEPSIYNRALSLAEIAAIYNAGSMGKCAPTPPPPPPAHTGTGLAAVTNGFVIGVNLTDGGFGYTGVPLVRFIGGGGSGAQGFAVVSNGVVTGITVTDAGSGYTSAPVVVIDPPFIPNPVLDIAPMSFLSFSNLTMGGTYQLQRSQAWYWTNQPVSFTATSGIYTQMVAGVFGSGDFRLALNPVPAQAFATPIAYFGFIVGANVTSGGSGYVSSPAVSIVGGGGTNATAMAQISGGVVTNILITDAGIGYTNTPTIRIAAPPAAAVSPTVLPVMRVDAAQLAPYDNYQIQFTPDLTAAWSNWNGGLFSPTATTNSQYLFITNDVGFFRLLYMP